MDNLEDMPEACQFCKYETALELFERQAQSPDRRKVWLCEVCASTLAGNVYRYPSQYSDDTVTIMRSISYTTNMILNAIKDNKLG